MGLPSSLTNPQNSPEDTTIKSTSKQEGSVKSRLNVYDVVKRVAAVITKLKSPMKYWLILAVISTSISVYYIPGKGAPLNAPFVFSLIPAILGWFSTVVCVIDDALCKRKLDKFIRAAENGHAEAQYILGSMYEQGKGARQSDYEAEWWCKKAAEQGHGEAQNNLASLYSKGGSSDEAVMWYKKAAAQGFVEAECNLAIHYGRRGAYKDALVWFEKAAAQGYAEAQYWLGHVYLKGQGVREDFGRGYAWLRLAERLGHERAKNEALALFTVMPLEQRCRASDIFKELLAKMPNRS